MAVWNTGSRPDPQPCRDGDEGKFEISSRDGRARVGKLHTKHGILETPALLPVINPNIRTIEPREMWDRYGISALITNSYIIWKHDELKQHALGKGVHDLLDYPGVIMTDSGTFQAYVYGDVEVGVEEIVEFQKSIGVDIATMLDVFSRPDMSELEVESAVDVTVERAQQSLDVAGDIMLNGPIQGGTFRHLRKKSAREMSAHDFAVHPIGGIVPIMEKHQYKDLAKIMLATLPELAPERPRHMFGCGHPMLFPMLIALGADLFDSAAYALFARDKRLLSPSGTVHLDDLQEWPSMLPCVVGHSPKEVLKMKEKERTAFLATYNLEVTLAELARCKQAVHDGTIWQLAEQRSHQHPALREAFLWLTTRPFPSGISPDALDDLIIDDRSAAREITPEGGIWEGDWSHVIDAQSPRRKKGERWGGEDTLVRPHILAARKQLHSRWRPENGNGVDVLILHGAPGPWRSRCETLVLRMQSLLPSMEIFVQTPLGLIPYGLEDLNPFAQVDGPSWLWNRRPNPILIRKELMMFSIDADRILTLDISQEKVVQKASELLQSFDIISEPLAIDDSTLPEQKVLLRRKQILQKLVVLANCNPESAHEVVEDCSFIVGGTGRVKNVINSSGKHILSPRLTDGGLSITDFGSEILYGYRSLPLPTEHHRFSPMVNPGEGLPLVVIHDDAVEFILRGRNVFHGFIHACDAWLTAGQTCLIVRQNGDLVGHGLSQCNANEALRLRKGIAVRTRSDFSKTINATK